MTRSAVIVPCTLFLFCACAQEPTEVEDEHSVALLEESTPIQVPTFCPAPTLLPQVRSHLVMPSLTDDGQLCHEADPAAIGCNGYTFDGKIRRDAPNDPHYLAYNSRYPRTGALVVYLPGTNGKPVSDPDAAGCTGSACGFYDLAVQQGYHVISLSYFTENDDENHAADPPSEPIHNVDATCGSNLDCYGQFMNEVLTGSVNCPASVCGSRLDISHHRQDSIEQRLLHVLTYAAASWPCEGWASYITHVREGEIDVPEVDWSKVTIAGLSLGSSYAAMIGIHHADIRRVVLFSSPNDGAGTSASDWVTAPWLTVAPAAARFYGLVHVLNKLNSEDDPSKLYRTLRAWQALGMVGRRNFDPSPGQTTDFLGRQMLVSTDAKTAATEAHTSVVGNVYKNCDVDTDANQCVIGYEDAWRYMLSTGL